MFEKIEASTSTEVEDMRHCSARRRPTSDSIAISGAEHHCDSSALGLNRNRPSKAAAGPLDGYEIVRAGRLWLTWFTIAQIFNGQVVAGRRWRQKQGTGMDARIEILARAFSDHSGSYPEFRK
jgi:hypothetical protein